MVVTHITVSIMGCKPDGVTYVKTHYEVTLTLIEIK